MVLAAIQACGDRERGTKVPSAAARGEAQIQAVENLIESTKVPSALTLMNSAHND
jgi:hypothetical protein